MLRKYRIILYFMIFNSWNLSAKEKQHNFYFELITAPFAQLSFQNGFENSIFYDNLIQGEKQNYKKGSYTTKWKEFKDRYGTDISFSFIYSQKKRHKRENWFVGTEFKHLNQELSYNLFDLNLNLQSPSKYGKGKSQIYHFYNRFFYGKSFFYKNFSISPYIGFYFHNLFSNHFSTPANINVYVDYRNSNFLLNLLFPPYPFFVPYYKTNGKEWDKFFRFRDRFPMKQMLRDGYSINSYLGSKIEKKVSNSSHLFFEASTYTFSIGKRYMKSNFVSYEKKNDNVYFGKSKSHYQFKNSNYKIGLRYMIGENFSVLFKLSYELWKRVYSNYKSIYISKNKEQIEPLGYEMFMNQFIYNRTYKNDSFNFNFGISYNIDIF